MPSAEMRAAMSGMDHEDTSVKCSTSLAMRERHSLLSGGLKA